MATKLVLPAPPSRPLLVAQLHAAANPDYYYLTLIDPYIGEWPAYCHHVEDIAEVCARLDVAAEARNLNFEVHDLSSGSMIVLKKLNDAKGSYEIG